MQLRSHITGGSVWQCEENHIVIGQHLRRCLSHQPISQWSQVGMVLAEECSRIGASRHGPDLDLRMRKQQTEQLSARIASSTRYSNPHTHPHEYAMFRNFMQRSVSRFGTPVLIIAAQPETAETSRVNPTRDVEMRIEPRSFIWSPIPTQP